jgi:hypothetical protein
VICYDLKIGGKKDPRLSNPKMKSATEQAMDLIKRWTTVAAKDGIPAGGYGVKVSPKGRYADSDNLRISYEAAVQIVADAVNQAATPALAIKTVQAETSMSWDRLNQATQAFFFETCEGMMGVSGDASVSLAVNQKFLKIGLVNAPRLSNLKKAGLIVTINGDSKSSKMLRLTEQGRSIFLDQIQST